MPAFRNATVFNRDRWLESFPRTLPVKKRLCLGRESASTRRGTLRESPSARYTVTRQSESNSHRTSPSRFLSNPAKETFSLYSSFRSQHFSTRHGSKDRQFNSLQSTIKRLSKTIIFYISPRCCYKGTPFSQVFYFLPSLFLY